VIINNLQFQDAFTASSCIESRGSLTMQNIAIFLCSGKRGAAIHQIGGKLTITNSAITGNQPSENGGCLAMEGGKLSLQDVDFTHSDNNAGNASPTAQTLSFPFGMSIVGKQLIVDDQGNSRFLIFSTQVSTAGRAAAGSYDPTRRGGRLLVRRSERSRSVRSPV
jgi:hypothetical protein